MKSDIIIIGGGASGLMAAIGAAQQFINDGKGGVVTLLEKMQRPGRKIMISGKGRCNFTNVKEWNDFSAHIRSKAEFVRPAFFNLPPKELISFFNDNYVKTVVERGDRAFPESYYASDIVDALVRLAQRLGVKMVTGCQVESVEFDKLFKVKGTITTIDIKTGERKLKDADYSSNKLIIATGGLSYPGTGSTGDGYTWAEQMGHKIVTCFPSLTAIVPEGYKAEPGSEEAQSRPFERGGRGGFRSDERDSSRPLPEGYPDQKGHINKDTPLGYLGSLLCGMSLKNVGLSILVDDEKIQDEFGEIEFTDGGLEGPIGFQVSRNCVEAIMKGKKVTAVLDLKPAVELDELKERIKGLWDEISNDPRSKGMYSRDIFRILLGKLMPWELTKAFLKCYPDVSVIDLAEKLKGWTFNIVGFVGYERSVVTAGGVSTIQIVAKTLESKKQKGLYFCGEVIDVDSDTGGYNLQTAFSTGYLAGQSAAKAVEEEITPEPNISSL